MVIKYSDDLIDEVIQRNDIVNIVSEYLNLKRTGRNYKALCPFHNEKTPSFVVSEEKQLYHCFGCGAAGNVINFIMNIENLDFIDAVEFLADKANIDISKYINNEYNLEKSDKRKKLYEINREAAVYFYKNLIQTKNAGLAYLMRRGLEIEIIKKFGLGYSIDDWESLNKYLLNKGYSQELIYESGLIVKRKDNSGYYDRFRNRVIFPIISPTKKVVGFGGRVLDDSIPKYLNSPESIVFNKGSILYGLNLARNELGKERRLIVVEGYMDVISLYQHGIKNVVATLGTALTKNHGELFKRYCNEVIIAYDADAAGEAATLRGLDILDEIGCKVRVLRLDDKMDPDEYIRAKGVKVFKQKLNGALPLIDYKINLLKQKNDINSDEGKINFAKEAVKILKGIKSPVEFNIYLNKVSDECGIPVSVIKREIYGNNRIDNKYKNSNINQKSKSVYINRYKKNTQIEPVKKIEKNGVAEVEKSIISLCLHSKNIYNKINSVINLNDFVNVKIKNIYTFLGNAYSNTDEINEDLVINKLDIEEAKMINEIMKSNVVYEDTDKAIKDLTTLLKKINIQNKIKHIKKKIKAMEMNDNKVKRDSEKIKELCDELFVLEKELMKLTMNPMDQKGGKSDE